MKRRPTKGRLTGISPARRLARLRRNVGFTLLELLAVIIIIGIIAALTIPSTGILGSTTLTKAAEELTATLNEASETAVVENTPIGIRFYEIASVDIPDSEEEFRAYQLVRLTDIVPEDPTQTATEVAETDLFYLPQQVLIMDTPANSTLVTTDSLECEQQQGESLPEAVKDATCYGFDFLPDGSTTLPKTAAEESEPPLWFLTLVEETDLIRTSGELPKNFITLGINPFTGTVRRYQP